MYRRYQATQQKTVGCGGSSAIKDDKRCSLKNEAEKNADKKEGVRSKNQYKASKFLTRLIPSSLYNPQNGKVLGVLSADDLFLIALILLIIDGGDEDEDNSMLVYALIYILLSEHIDLPF